MHFLHSLVDRFSYMWVNGISSLVFHDCLLDSSSVAFWSKMGESGLTVMTFVLGVLIELYFYNREWLELSLCRVYVWW